MKNQEKKVKLIRWIARIWGTIILVFILTFFLGYAFGDEGLGFDKISNHEKITFIFFPIATIVGLLIAYKNEKIGGLIATLGMIVFFIMQPEVLTKPFVFLGILPPGILYLIYWFLSKKNR